MMMKYYRAMIVAGLLTALEVRAATVSLSGANADKPKQSPRIIPVDGYAARVNDRVITYGEIRRAMAPVLQQLFRTYSGKELEQEVDKAFQRTREDFIERALILEAFKQSGAHIPDEYVKSEVDRIIRERFGGDEALFEQMLTREHKTRQEFMDEVRDHIAVGLMLSKEVNQRVRITPAQVREEYERHKDRYYIPEKVKFSAILINKGTTEEERKIKREEAESVRKKLLDGADFAEIARKYSEGARSAEGGSFPWMKPKDVPEELREAVEKLPAGKISDLIETDRAFYIIRVDARRMATYKPFDEVRDQIKKELADKERERLRKRWIERLKKENYVVIYDE